MHSIFNWSFNDDFNDDFQVKSHSSSSRTSTSTSTSADESENTPLGRRVASAEFIYLFFNGLNLLGHLSAETATHFRRSRPSISQKTSEKERKPNKKKKTFRYYFAV